MSFQIWPRNRVVQQISTWRCSMLSSIIIVVTIMLASASESFLISFMLHSPTTIFFIISPSSLSHSQILTPRVRLPSSKLPNALNWKISKCWNLQFEDYNLNWEILNSPSLQFWTQLYQLHPDVNSLTMIQHKKNIKKGMFRAAFFASDRKMTNFSGRHQAYHLVQVSSSAWFE